MLFYSFVIFLASLLGHRHPSQPFDHVAPQAFLAVDCTNEEDLEASELCTYKALRNNMRVVVKRDGLTFIVEWTPVEDN